MIKVYFIYAKATGHVKIGYTNSIDDRLATLQTGSPLSLTVILEIPCESESHARNLESAIHKLCDKHRVRGEWFRWTGVKKILRGAGFPVRTNVVWNEILQDALR